MRRRCKPLLALVAGTSILVGLSIRGSADATAWEGTVTILTHPTYPTYSWQEDPNPKF